jgi:hypothetical protein
MAIVWLLTIPPILPLAQMVLETNPFIDDNRLLIGDFACHPPLGLGD